MKDELAFETLAVHAGQPPDPLTGAVIPPIYMSSTFRQRAVGKHQGYEYSRTANPTRDALEQCMAKLEAGVRGLAFASGMAATDAVVHLLEPGDHILASDDLYGGTIRLFDHVYAKYGIGVTYADASNTADFLRQVRNETRLIWLETPTNPYLRLCDVAAICEGAKELPGERLVCVDNTFATPYLQQPLLLGADLVVHSTTKYLGGHSDIVGGALIARDAALAERLAFLQNAVGAVPSPLDCFLVLRGIKTLHLRMDRHAENARKVVDFLVEQPGIANVHYPGHDSHPQKALAERQMRNGGGMVSFVLEGGEQASRRVAEATKIFTLAESLGAVESLIEVPAAMTHTSTAGTHLAVDPGLIRLSIGVESADDLISDLRGALREIG